MARPLGIVVILCAAAGTAHAQWDAEVPITSTTSDVWGEGIATAGDTVHVVYGTGEVRYRRSTDQGATWSADRMIGAGDLHLTDPIVADGDDVWVLALRNLQSRTDWCCARDLGDLYLLHSGDGGATWDQPRQLTTARGAYRLSIAYAADRLHVVWMDYRDGAWDTYYLRSPDRGATWDAERRISASMGTFGSERPQVAARGDDVHVTIWNDRGTNPPCMAGPTFSFDVCPDTFYIGSTDGGTTWGNEVAVAYSGAAIAGRNDVAVAGTSSVVINFNRSAENTADNNPHLFTVRSPDNGATWEAPLQLTDTPGEADHGSIIGAGSAVHLVWHDSRDGALAIYYRASITEGASWLPEEKVSTATTTESSTPLVATTRDYVHVLWLDHRSGSYQIYYRRRAFTAPADPDGGNSGDPDGGTAGDGAPAGGCCGTSRDGGATSWLASLATLGLLTRRRRRRA